MIAGQGEVPADQEQSPPPLNEATPPFARRGEDHCQRVDGRQMPGRWRGGTAARCGSRKQSPVFRRTASATPSTDSQHWPETTA